MEQIKISLLDNCYGFLEEALSKAIQAENDSNQWKYATLNLVQSIELSLKEKLKREHSILIFKNIDSPKQTVNIETAINRLQRIGNVTLTETDKTTISKAAEIRNRIVHFEFDFNVTEIKLIFAKLLGFLSEFHIRKLDNALDQIIPQELWEEAISIFEYSEELFSRAQKIFKEEKFDDLLIWVCKKCDWEAFVIQDDINTCYVCGHTSNIFQCPECEELFYAENGKEFQTGDGQFELFCFDCYEKKWSELEEHYHYDMMSYYYNKKSGLS